MIIKKSSDHVNMDINKIISQIKSEDYNVLKKFDIEENEIYYQIFKNDIHIADIEMNNCNMNYELVVYFKEAMQEFKKTKIVDLFLDIWCWYSESEKLANGFLQALNN